jgi:signal transduction histidine kinase
VTEATTALAELRDIAHGVFPATLESTGLASALAGLVERSGAAVRLEVAAGERLPPAVERAAYWVVAAFLGHADPTVAQRVTVSRRDGAQGDELTVRFRPVHDMSLTAVSDRVGAVGGTVRVDGDAVQVVIPCG